MDDIISYDSEERAVYFTGKDDRTEIFQDVGVNEYKEIQKLESYSHKCMVAPERLLQILQGGLMSLGSSSDELRELRSDIIQLYRDFSEHKCIAEESEFERVRGYCGVIYKSKRPLENTFETIGIVADIMTNSKLIYQCNRGDFDRYHLHHLIVNTCAAFEQLGIIAVNRLASESGGIDPNSQEYNVSNVYEKIIVEDIHEPINEENEFPIDINQDDVIRYKKMRDNIAHSSPMQESPSLEIPPELSDDICFYGGSEIKDFLKISIRLNQLASTVLIRFVLDHVRAGIDPYVAAVYQD